MVQSISLHSLVFWPGTMLCDILHGNSFWRKYYFRSTIYRLFKNARMQGARNHEE